MTLIEYDIFLNVECQKK